MSIINQLMSEDSSCTDILAIMLDFSPLESLLYFHLIQSGETKVIKTGLSFEIPEGKAFLIWDRGGMGVKGVHTFAGVLDSDFRGELRIVLHNSTSENYEVKKGDRICQAIIQDYYKPEFEEVEELSDAPTRGENWNHSTGR